MQCICVAKSNPEAVITFELPTRNVTVNETDREFVYSQKNGYVITSILTLRGELDSQLYIVCAARNLYGAKNQQLQFHHSSEGPPYSYTHCSQNEMDHRTIYGLWNTLICTLKVIGGDVVISQQLFLGQAGPLRISTVPEGPAMPLPLHGKDYHSGGTRVSYLGLCHSRWKASVSPR